MKRDVELPAPCLPLVRAVDEELGRLLRERRDEMVSGDAGVAAAFDELDRLVGAGGKRLRPLFCLLGNAAAGGTQRPEIVRVAAALELLHTFAIVHDDVMDGSPKRRGEPSSWAQMAQAHRQKGLRGDADAFGVAAAVLVGDLALILADQAFLASGFAPSRLVPAFDRYNRMRSEMVAGQYLDVLAAREGGIAEEDARRIALLKSGLYTVEGPLHIGAMLAEAGQDVLAALSAYGTALGEAFQIRDDVLGVFGDPSDTGKDRHSDLREGKRTVLLVRTLALLSEEDRQFVEGRLGDAGISGGEVDRIRTLMEESGALASTVALVEGLTERAKAALNPAVLPADVAHVLNELADVLALRPA